MLSKIPHIVFVVVSCAIVSACKERKPSLNQGALISYYENPANGFVVEIESGKLVYKFQSKLPEYVASQEALTSGSIGPNEIRDRIRQLDSSIWFNLKIQTKASNINPLKLDIDSYTAYQARLNYFLYEAEKNFRIDYKGITIAPIAYYFENSYGAMPYETLIVGFKLSDNFYNSDIVLKYNDEVFNTGQLKIEINKEKLINKPTLTF